jgi:hypothetical protein
MDAEMTAVKTGTSTIGICFDGGVVVGADHRATMGHFVANKSVQKLFRIADNLALTTAGLVGHAQSLSRTLAAEMSLFELKRGRQMTVKGAATMTANILVGRPHWVQLLIAGVDETGGSVYSIDSACTVCWRPIQARHDRERGPHCRRQGPARQRPTRCSVRQWHGPLGHHRQARLPSSHRRRTQCIDRQVLNIPFPAPAPSSTACPQGLRIVMQPVLGRE